MKETFLITEALTAICLILNSVGDLLLYLNYKLHVPTNISLYFRSKYAPRICYF